MKDGRLRRQQRAGEREDLPELPARGEEQGRAQLAARQGQRDLPSGRRARAPGRSSTFPSGSTRSTAPSSSARRAASGPDARRRHARRRGRDRATRAASRVAAARAPLYNARCGRPASPTRLEAGHADNALPQTAARRRQLPRAARRDAGGRAPDARARPRRTTRSPSRRSAPSIPSPPSPLTPELMRRRRDGDARAVAGRARRARHGHGGHRLQVPPRGRHPGLRHVRHVRRRSTTSARTGATSACSCDRSTRARSTSIGS